MLPTLRGKVEFEMGEEGREAEVIGHLLPAGHRRRRTANGSRGRTCRLHRRTSTDGVGRRDRRTSCRPDAALGQLGAVPGLAGVLARLGVGEDNVSPGQVAAAVEFVLEGLHLTRRLSKDSVDGQTIYGS